MIRCRQDRQHLLHAIPGRAALRFYLATARRAVRKIGEGVRRISLDGHGLRVGQGGKNLSQLLLALVKELRIHRRGITGMLRLFFDRGGYKGFIFEALSKLQGIHFYSPNVEQWEALNEEDFPACGRQGALLLRLR